MVEPGDQVNIVNETQGPPTRGRQRHLLLPSGRPDLQDQLRQSPWGLAQQEDAEQHHVDDDADRDDAVGDGVDHRASSPLLSRPASASAAGP
jgi:hypothetical protein